MSNIKVIIKSVIKQFDNYSELRTSLCLLGCPLKQLCNDVLGETWQRLF